MTQPLALCSPDHLDHLTELCAPYGLEVEAVPTGTPITGSYWGAPEAGLVANRLIVRPDTPLHSALHEACHFICMDDERRRRLHTDAGGEIAEENAVCYLQGLLAEDLPDYGREHLFADMDAWGYSFRLGSAAAWFQQDAEDARTWLIRHRVIDYTERPTGQCRR